MFRRDCRCYVLVRREKRIPGYNGAKKFSPLSRPPLPAPFFERPVDEVGRDLLGCRLISDIRGTRVTGRIVETEAYGMEEDAFYGRHIRPTASGTITTSPTGKVLLADCGAAFIYSVFFGNWLLNVVAGPPGYLGCVLIRAVEPLEGIDEMRRRRNTTDKTSKLASGPGRLTRAFGVDGSLNGHHLRFPPLTLCTCTDDSPLRIESSPRIGVKKGRDLLWRFVDAGSASLSRPVSRIADRPGSP